MKNVPFLFIIVLLSLLGACESEDMGDITPEIQLPEETEIETPDWTEATHSKEADPDYTTVFPDDKVQRFDIRIDAEYWSTMQADLAANLSGNGGPGGGDLDFQPIWVPCSFTYNGIEWYKVGIRYKGNSTLRNAYNGNSDKYPFKLDFDEFEDNFPAINNQRFYGFKQLVLSNNYSDASAMREKVAADLFREFGVPAARTSFAAIYLDRGNGSQFIGLYTLIEEVDNTLAESQFEDKNGNLYKPEGTGATFSEGTYNDEEMYKKSNEEEADYTDIKALYNTLHSAIRLSDEAQWKSELEAVLDVDRYLKYLAVNMTIQNWDTYGRMTHNYFLYNEGTKLVWIPWDNNESMQQGKMGGALSLGLSEVGNGWPLIRYIIDVEEYETKYKAYLKEFVEQVFEPTRMSILYSKYESLIGSFASQENGSFSSAVSSLKAHAQNRKQVVDSFLE